MAYVEVHLTGYRGRRLRLRWGLSEARRDGRRLPSTDHVTELAVPQRADSINFFLPVWISLPKTSFEIRFYLSDRSSALLQLATSAPLRGSHYRYECVPD